MTPKQAVRSLAWGLVAELREDWIARARSVPPPERAVFALSDDEIDRLREIQRHVRRRARSAR